jgi:hypothetical protein
VKNRLKQQIRDGHGKRGLQSGDPRDPVRAGCGQVLDHGKCKCEGGFGAKVIGAGRLSGSQSEDRMIRQAKDS